jgi:hypothetical protein
MMGVTLDNSSSLLVHDASANIDLSKRLVASDLFRKAGILLISLCL